MSKVIILATFLSILSCTSDGRHGDAARSVGNYLLESALTGSLFTSGNNGHPNIVRVGESLKSKLKELTPTLSRDCTSKLIENSDEKASHLLLLVCNAHPVIGLRLKYDGDYNAFHILGYWSSGLPALGRIV
tara:strand:- start:83496 stop:83891 length:396 start_codon:yes stop_codon:yes gene_type:complete